MKPVKSYPLRETQSDDISCVPVKRLPVEPVQRRCLAPFMDPLPGADAVPGENSVML